MSMKRNMLLRFFISYLCLLLPILLLSFILAQSTIGKMKADLDSSVDYQLDRLTREMDNRYVTYQNTGISLSAAPELLGYKMLANSINAAYGLEVLKDVCAYNTDIFDVFMVYGTPRIFSAKGVSDISVYFSRTLECIDASIESGISLLSKETNGVSFLYNKSGGGYLLLHLSTRIGTLNNNVSVNYCLSLALLKSILEPLTDNNSAYVSMISESGDAFRFYGNAAGGLEIIQAEQYPLEGDLEDYTLLSRTSQTMGITIEVLYRTDFLYKDIRSWQMLNYVFIACGLLFSMIISYYMSKRRYTHIEQLASTITRGTTAPTIREFDYIQRMIRRVVDECQDWENTAKTSTTLLKQQTATMIFHGLLKEPEGIRQILKVCGLELYEEYFFIGGILMDGGENAYRSLEKMMEGDLFVRTTINGKVAILFLAEIPNPDFLRKARLRTAEQLSQVIGDFGGSRVRVGLSQVYQSLSMAGYAYMEALSALELMEDDGREKHFECWESVIKAEKATLRLDQEHLEDFTGALEKRHFSRAEKSLAQILKYIALKPCSDENRRYLRFCILQPLIIAIKNSGTEDSGQWLENVARINPDDPAEFEKAVKKVLQTFCRSSDKSYDFENIVKYIEENYSNFDLSLEKVADNAGLTKNYLSRLFKERTGNCYIDYLSQLRMEKAREFLSETDLSIKEIVLKVGYIDESSFRKKFKAEYGINASEYRRKENLRKI